MPLPLRWFLEFTHGGGKRLRRFGVKEHRGISPDLPENRDVADDDGCATGHRFDEWQPEALVEGRGYESCRGPEDGRVLLIADALVEDDRARGGERGQPPHLGLVCSAQKVQRVSGQQADPAGEQLDVSCTA